MPTIERINKPVVQRLGNDSIYGEGIDGNVTIASDTTLTRDMYYRTLTVNSGTNLVTNGFRNFVEKTLTNNGTIGLPSGLGGAVASGTLVGRVADAAGTKQYVLGQSVSGTQVPEAVLKDLKQVIQGWHFDPVDGIKKIEGGDDGTAGSDTAGAAGGAGGAGSHPGAGPGGLGAPGTSGSAGGTGAGGAKGIGGGLVVIVANTVLGAGYIVSQGDAGDAGSSGATGGAGTAGNTQNANVYQDGSNAPGANPGNTATGPAPGDTSSFAGNSPHTGHAGQPASTSYADVPAKANSDAPAAAVPPNYSQNPPVDQPPACKEVYAPPNPPYQVQGNAHHADGPPNGPHSQTGHHYTVAGHTGNVTGHFCTPVAPHAHGDAPFVVHAGHGANIGDPPVATGHGNTYSFDPGNPPVEPIAGQPPTYTPGDIGGFQNQSNPNFASNTQYTGGAAGAGGAGGTGTSGNIGGQGGLLIVTEAALPAGMATGDFSTVVLNP